MESFGVAGSSGAVLSLFFTTPLGSSPADENTFGDRDALGAQRTGDGLLLHHPTNHTTEPLKLLFARSEAVLFM